MTAAPVWSEAVWRRLEGHALVEAENHRPEPKGGGCICGFCAWSAEHVLVMSIREARVALLRERAVR